MLRKIGFIAILLFLLACAPAAQYEPNELVVQEPILNANQVMGLVQYHFELHPFKEECGLVLYLSTTSHAHADASYIGDRLWIVSAFRDGGNGTMIKCSLSVDDRTGKVTGP